MLFCARPARRKFFHVNFAFLTSHASVMGSQRNERGGVGTRELTGPKQAEDGSSDQFTPRVPIGKRLSTDFIVHLNHCHRQTRCGLGGHSCREIPSHHQTPSEVSFWGKWPAASRERRCLELAGLVFPLLHRRQQLFADAGQSLLNQACQLLLPAELGLRVFLCHPNRSVSSNFRRFDT